MGRAVSRGTTLPPLRMSLPSKEASSNKTSSDEFPREGPRTVPPRCGSHALRSPPPSLAQKRALVHPTEFDGGILARATREQAAIGSAPARHAWAAASPAVWPLRHPVSAGGRAALGCAGLHALHLAPAHDTPSMPANRSSTGTLGQPLPGMHGQPLPPVPGRLSPALVTGSHPQSGPIHVGTTATPAQPPPRPVQTPSLNLAAPVPSAAAAVRPRLAPTLAPPRPAAPAIARPASAPVAAYHPPSIPAAPYRPSPPPAVHAAAPPVFRPPPAAVHAAPPPAFHPPAPTVRAAPAAPAAVAHRPPPAPGRRG